MVGSFNSNSSLRNHLPNISVPSLVSRRNNNRHSSTNSANQSASAATNNSAAVAGSLSSARSHTSNNNNSNNNNMTETTPPSSSAAAGANNSSANNNNNNSNSNSNLGIHRPYNMSHRISTDDTQLLRVPSISRNGGMTMGGGEGGALSPPALASLTTPPGGMGSTAGSGGGGGCAGGATCTHSHHNHHLPTKTGGNNNNNSTVLPIHCLNPASEINARLDTQVEVRVYPCNNNSQAGNKKKFTQFNVKPEGVIIQGTNRHRAANNDLGAEYAQHIGRKLQRYELSDTRACQLLVTTHNKSFWVVPAPEAFSRHSGTCRLLGDRKHQPASHTLQVGDFLRVGSVGVVVIETHDGTENRILSEEKIQKIMKDTTSNTGGFLDLAETDGENSDDSSQEDKAPRVVAGDDPVCYMCFDEEDTAENPMITPCKCLGDTRYVHVDCLRKWHTAEADNQICFLSSVDATCSVCKSTFRSDFKLKDGRLVKLFKSSLEPPYVSLLVATKHEMAQRLFNTRFQLSFSTLLKPDGKNGTRPLLLGRSSGSDMVLDYRTVSARHATIRLKNGEFIFTDAGSSNGSYLYLRRPVELTPSQSVQFRLGRSMISMKVVNKWNRRLLRAVSRRVTGSNNGGDSGDGDDHSVGSNDDDVRITDNNGSVTRTLPRKTREYIMESMPPPGTLSQNSSQHLHLLYALAYPKRAASEKDINKHVKSNQTPALLPPPMEHVSEGEDDESKAEDDSEELHVVQLSPLEDVSDNFHDMDLNDDEQEDIGNNINTNFDNEMDNSDLTNEELKETDDNSRPGTPDGELGETDIHEETVVEGTGTTVERS